MKVAFHLRRLQVRAPATALLLPGHDVGQLLDLCTRWSSATLPSVYVVEDGFLLKLPGPTSAIHPGVIRLQSVADNLLIPVDAQLVPALLDDEATGLVRERGLIFLPGGRVLAFAPQEPVPFSG